MLYILKQSLIGSRWGPWNFRSRVARSAIWTTILCLCWHFILYTLGPTFCTFLVALFCTYTFCTFFAPILLQLKPNRVFSTGLKTDCKPVLFWLEERWGSRKENSLLNYFTQLYDHKEGGETQWIAMFVVLLLGIKQVTQSKFKTQ